MFDSRILTKPIFLFRQLVRRLWVRTSLIAALALVSASLGPVLGPLVPATFAERLNADAVGRILEILASSMLAVTTFSLSIMVAAQKWASNQSSPRAQQVIEEDTVTQNALATFLGAFIFALASLILVETGVYDERSNAVILAFTFIVILLVVIAILRWIEQLSNLGGVSETADKIETAARRALRRRSELPCLGAVACDLDSVPGSAEPVTAETTGYVRHVDTGMLEERACADDSRIWILALPGTFIAAGQPLARVSGPLDEDRVRAAFLIGAERSFDQDPRFSLQILSEIAQRALSPGVNDPATAITIMGRLLRLLVPLTAETAPEDTASFTRVAAPPIPTAALLEDAFAAIARDAGDKVEVHLFLQSALERLANSQDDEMAGAARAASRRALAFADRDLVLKEDRDRVNASAPVSLKD
ncbi:DUF2254 domain-containing protein [Ruegeria sediminis]|uniref:DUF2254 domain-containing protein n=1 Tax=Ruegeria sediminis TaxID=2583820 RepID=A0ABY2X4A4_9RHOB|nr:DUF2254 domain-containing protein [Ruegeria sediminis]TMV09885.1 DUF2254 domain-containing protein [Ruegeria sediminis]